MTKSAPQVVPAEEVVGKRARARFRAIPVTTNPNARWHSYTVGGCQFGFKGGTAEPAFATQAHKRQIAGAIDPTHAVVKGGEWHESPLWCFFEGRLLPYPIEEWNRRFDELMADVSDDDLLTYVSCYRSEDGPTNRAATHNERLGVNRDQGILQAMGLHYQSTRPGHANPSAVPKMVYYGRVIRVPAREFEDPVRAWRRRDLFGDLPSLLRPLGGLVPAGQGPLERYEVRDIDTNDVWVMWRVPYAVHEMNHTGPDKEACVRGELCRLAVTNALGLSYSCDLSVAWPESDALQAGDNSIQVIPAWTSNQASESSRPSP